MILVSLFVNCQLMTEFGEYAHCGLFGKKYNELKKSKNRTDFFINSAF